MFTGNMWPHTHLCDNDTVTVAMIYTLWTILLGHLSHHTNGNFKPRGDKVNKKREKNEKREDKRKTIQQLMKTVQCLTCKSLRTQEIGLAYSGCRSSGRISDYGTKPENPRVQPKGQNWGEKCKMKNVICTWRSRFAYGAFNQTAVQLNSVDDFNNKVAQTSYSGILFCKYGSFPK